MHLASTCSLIVINLERKKCLLRIVSGFDDICVVFMVGAIGLKHRYDHNCDLIEEFL